MSLRIGRSMLSRAASRTARRRLPRLQVPRRRRFAEPPRRSFVSQPWSCFRGPQYGVSPWTNVAGGLGRRERPRRALENALKTSCVGSPVLWQDRIFLTEADENERAVLAFDAASGKELWRQAVADGGKDAPLPPVADSALAMPTPACDAEGVYVLFGTGDFAAFTHDGRPRWQIFLKRPEIGYGFASSPCVGEGLVCVQFDELNGGRVLAVESATGNSSGNSRGPAARPGPRRSLVPGPDGKPLLVVNANGSATAYDLAGKMIWDVDGVNGQVTPSPAWSDNRVYLANVGSRLICYDVSGQPEAVLAARRPAARRGQPRGRQRAVFHGHQRRPTRVRGRHDRPGSLDAQEPPLLRFVGCQRRSRLCVGPRRHDAHYRRPSHLPRGRHLSVG